MDDINDQTESMKQIQEALSAPIGAAADYDEDELEAELEELEEADLEDELFQPATTAPSASVSVDVPVGRQPTRPAPQRWPFESVLYIQDDADELNKLLKWCKNGADRIFYCYYSRGTCSISQSFEFVHDNFMTHDFDFVHSLFQDHFFNPK